MIRNSTLASVLALVMLHTRRVCGEVTGVLMNKSRSGFMSGIGGGRPVGKMWRPAFGRHDDQTSVRGSAELGPHSLKIWKKGMVQGSRPVGSTDGPGFATKFRR